MKTTKLMLAIAFFAFSTLAFAQTDKPDTNEPPPSITIKITLKAALNNSDLVKSMQEQLDPGFLHKVLRPQYFTAKVKHRRVVYVIYGTYHEWMRFFRIRPLIDPAGTADQ